MLIMRILPNLSEEDGFSYINPASALDTLLERPALRELAWLYQNGQIHRLVPLARGANADGRQVNSEYELAAIMAAGMQDQAAESTNRDPNAGVFIVELLDDVEAENLQRDLEGAPGVDFVAPVAVRYLADSNMFPASIPPPSAFPLWNLDRIQWPHAVAAGFSVDARDIRVGVLDTGVDPRHPDLAGSIGNYEWQYGGLPSAPSMDDISGHGTHVAGIIAAVDQSGNGIHGICESELFIWKVVGDTAQLCGGGFTYIVDPILYHHALADCSEAGIHVLNVSLAGTGNPNPQELQLFQELIDSDITVVAAMGNQRTSGSPTCYPAAIPGVIAVGATDVNDKVASFSNGGQHIGLCAPGIAIWSTLPRYAGQTGFRIAWSATGVIQGAAKPRETDYNALRGTSMAAPHVSGAVALLLAHHGPMSPAAVRARLINTADPVSGMAGQAFHPDYGGGRLNLLRLLL
jgi:subtilisin family serine protease